MLASHLVKQLNVLANHWDEQRSRIQTTAEIEARNRFVRERFLDMIGGFPARGPLQAVTVRVVEREGYRVENVMFQSRPDFWVTGNLYIPALGSGPLPAIISPCGHYPLARMIPQYQAAYLSLAKSGFVVLAYDPIGQGERRQYWNPQTDVTEVEGGPVFEHSMPRQLLLLLGETLTQYLIWDGMRAIDYLQTRREVDPKRIGCTGHSGGGTLTQFSSALDERIQCAAVIEGGTANRWPVQLLPGSRLSPADIEQNLFPAAIYGIDNVDVHVAIAPRPLLAAIEHITPHFGRASQAIQKRYRQLGVAERFTTVEADDPHSWTVKLRLATTDWFFRWFYHRPGPTTEPAFAYEAPETLYCSHHGSLGYAQQGQTIFSLIRAKQAPLPPFRRTPTSPSERASYQQDMQAIIRELLRVRISDQALEPQLIVTTPRKGYRIEKVEFLSEPGVYIPAWVFIPERKRDDRPTILFISDAGVQADGMEFEGSEESGLRPGFLQSLTLAGNLVVAVDVRGVGETKPSYPAGGVTSEKFGQLFDTATALSYMAWSADLSLLGMRVQDVIRSIDYVSSRQDANLQGLRVIGKGSGGLWALYAAVLDSRIRALVCQESLISYRALTEVDRYRYGAEIFVPKVLLQFDLPGVAAAMAPRNLTLISPLDAMKERLPLQIALDSYRLTQDAYESAGAQDQFRIACEENPSQAILNLWQDHAGGDR
jgi:cephalosporin-C deacetylase-like acetyl esterase